MRHSVRQSHDTWVQLNTVKYRDLRLPIWGSQRQFQLTIVDYKHKPLAPELISKTCLNPYSIYLSMHYGEFSRNTRCFDKAKGLQAGAFLLDSAPMSCNKFITTLISAVAILLSGFGVAQATEQQQKLSDEPSLFERYTSNAQDLILKGLQLVGINYRRGGTSEANGVDCSGFVQLVYKDAVGLLLPRTAREQSEVGSVVDKSELKPGDLVFFNTMRRAFSHVGIYLGDNRFLHSPRTGAEVRVEDMSQGYWVKRYNGARRVVEH